MPDILDSTKAGINANSYASVDEADDYLDNRYRARDWAELNEDDKERLLITATRIIDRLGVPYTSTTDTQVLKFPLSTRNAVDRYNRPLGDGYDKAQEATIIQAHYLSQYDDELQEAQGNRIQGIKEQRIGTSVARSSNGWNPIGQISSEALQVMAPYIDLTVRVVR